MQPGASALSPPEDAADGNISDEEEEVEHPDLEFQPGAAEVPSYDGGGVSRFSSDNDEDDDKADLSDGDGDWGSDGDVDSDDLNSDGFVPKVIDDDEAQDLKNRAHERFPYQEGPNPEGGPDHMKLRQDLNDAHVYAGFLRRQSRHEHSLLARARAKRHKYERKVERLTVLLRRAQNEADELRAFYASIQGGEGNEAEVEGAGEGGVDAKYDELDQSDKDIALENEDPEPKQSLEELNAVTEQTVHDLEQAVKDDSLNSTILLTLTMQDAASLKGRLARAQATREQCAREFGTLESKYAQTKSRLREVHANCMTLCSQVTYSINNDESLKGDIIKRTAEILEVSKIQAAIEQGRIEELNRADANDDDAGEGRALSQLQSDHKKFRRRLREAKRRLRSRIFGEPGEGNKNIPVEGEGPAVPEEVGVEEEVGEEVDVEGDAEGEGLAGNAEDSDDSYSWMSEFEAEYDGVARDGGDELPPDERKGDDIEVFDADAEMAKYREEDSIDADHAYAQALQRSMDQEFSENNRDDPIYGSIKSPILHPLSPGVERGVNDRDDPMPCSDRPRARLDYSYDFQDLGQRIAEENDDRAMDKVVDRRPLKEKLSDVCPYYLLKACMMGYRCSKGHPVLDSDERRFIDGGDIGAALQAFKVRRDFIRENNVVGSERTAKLRSLERELHEELVQILKDFKAHERLSHLSESVIR